MNKIDHAIRSWALQRNCQEELFLPNVGFLSVVQARPTEIIQQSGGAIHQRLIAPFYGLGIAILQSSERVIHVVDLLSCSMAISEDSAQGHYDNWLSGQLYADHGSVVIEAMAVIEFTPQGQVIIGSVNPLFEQMLNPCAATHIPIDPIRESRKTKINHRGGITKTTTPKIYLILAIIAAVGSFLFLIYMFMPQDMPLKTVIDKLIDQII